jgi:hypothetical protein
VLSAAVQTFAFDVTVVLGGLDASGVVVGERRAEVVADELSPFASPAFAPHPPRHAMRHDEVAKNAGML